jgi:carbon-monoxide dehydrogenase large subunit
MPAVATRFVGTKVKRVEDPRLLTGRGRYVDDVVVRGMLHAAFTRSPHAHARIARVDAGPARRVPGVVAVFTGRDMEALTNPFVGLLPLPGLYHPMHYALAIDRVRMVGDPVALVVATTRAIAEDAAEHVVVEYEPLTPVATIDQALDPTRPAIWPGARGNVLFRATEEYGDVAGEFRRADHVVRQRFVQHRHSNQPMETRGCVAEVDPVLGTLSYYAGAQSPHMLKWSLALLTDRQPVWRSLQDAWRERRRLQELARVGAAYAKRARERAAAAPVFPPPPLRKEKPGDPRAMIEPFLREPARVAHLVRALVGLVVRDPIRLPRVQAQDIGGAFGAKALVTPEDVAVVAAAVSLGRSLKWIEDRNEHLLVGSQARDERVDVAAAFTRDGALRGWHADLALDQGAYSGFPVGAAMYPSIIGVMMPGPYRVPAYRFDATVTASNKATYGAYRGPWAVETWVRERMLDVAARELGIGRDEIRLRNMVTPAELPTRMITGPTLDVRMSARATLERALALAEFAEWPARQAAARSEGRLLGLGLSTFIEGAPGPPDLGAATMGGGAMGAALGAEPARLVLEEDGTVAVVTQQMPHGQGHETTLAQVAADEVGVPIEQVRVRFGDTAITPFGVAGTGGSRSAAMAGGAVTMGARALRDRIRDLGADLLEAAPEDVTISAGAVHVVGSPSVSVSLADVAAHAARTVPDRVPGEALRELAEWDGGEGGWAQATHVCWVEVDLATGVVRIPRYLVVEDCGELINPQVVDGQIAGGVAQGIGAVLYEKTVYDDAAQVQTGTFLDYLIPTAAEIPDIEIHHLQTPSTIEANYRGVGEGGMIAAPAAVTNAIEDALAHLGVRVTEQHLPPTRILELAGVIPAAG